eukprot:TRINITY_DN12548_c0_g1_i1.p1 TRINITY_DN12548_c0_g1~~TRINITY_DN12548_c0_g1_i1.p1  ORF type:complete len:320 (-),score=67.54 TRINITY_DN12548_c0_g1_i1:321-1280(-)
MVYDEDINRDGFYISYTEEPHATRRKLIKAKYPEITKLEGVDSNLKWAALIIVTLQTVAAYYLRNSPWWKVVVVAYCFGGILNHSATLCFHEISHNLAFTKNTPNRMLGIFVNLPLMVPSASTFRRYHMEHHQYQGSDGVDVDIPSELEGKLLNNIVGKLFFIFLQPAFYALRPVFIRPKSLGFWEFANWAAQIAYNAAIWYLFSWKALMYLGLCSLLGLGFHPMAGHFIAEHYVFNKGVETYSYYGPLNIFGFHVGYHNEHHDFPRIPGSRLHKVREIAPEFYENLPQYTSWFKVLLDFITYRHMSPYSRVKRHLRNE